MNDRELAYEIERGLTGSDYIAYTLRDSEWRAIIAALRRSQPEPVPEGFVRTVPDPQMRTMCTAQAMGQQLAKLQEEGEMPTERMVEVAAQWLSESPLIQEPKLPPPAWMGLARHVLQAALSAAEAEGEKIDEN